MKFCCKEFEKEATSISSSSPTGIVYPEEMQPTGQIERDDDGSWNVNGCCGGGCYVLTKIKFCPFCGTRLTIG